MTDPTVRQSYFRRLAQTPMRDFVRGRITGRLDVRHLLEISELTPRLRSLVDDVVRRTRLWRTEKADVAVELIAHFRDGIASGEKPEALEASFGDVPQAARLIRRAKRRARPVAWRASVRATQVSGAVVGLFMALYLLSTVRLFTGRPTIARDYLAEVNAAASSLPESDRAWPLYRTALLLLGEPFDRVLTSVRPGQDRWDEVAAYLAPRAEVLRLVRDAAAKHGMGFAVGYAVADADRPLWPQVGESPGEYGLGAAQLQYLGKLTEMAELLALDAYGAADRGDGAAVAADIHAILGISEHAREVPCLANGVQAVRLLRMAVDTAGEILAAQPEVLAGRQLRHLAHRLGAAHGGRPEISLEGERLFVKDLLQRLYTDDGNGDGRLTARGLQSLQIVYGGERFDVGPASPVVGIVAAGRRAMAGELARWLAAAEAESAKPLWLQDPHLVERQVRRLEQSPLYATRYFLVPMLMPNLGIIRLEAELVTQRRDAVCAAIALELYRRANGSWPSSLQATVPELLPSVPLDRYTGDSLQYRLVDGRPLLYSAGADRDDDDGRPSRRGEVYFADASAADDGDWILWPRQPAPVGSAVRTTSRPP